MKHTNETKLNAIVMLDGAYVDTLRDIDDITTSKDGQVYMVDYQNITYIFRRSQGFLIMPYFDVPAFKFSIKDLAVEQAIDKTMEELYEASNLSQG